jgi:YD repeat-containing protein
MPDPLTGELLIDPEIALKARGFGLQLEFYYSSYIDSNQSYPTGTNPYGVGRSASVDAYVASTVGGGYATMVQGDFLAHRFSLTAGTVPLTYEELSKPYSRSTLVYDGSKFQQLYADGFLFEYTDQNQSGSTRYHKIARVVDPRGNVHTYNYSGSGLSNIQVADGRRVTFAYDGNNRIESVRDWGGRRWTFAYDGSGYLTDYTTPLGCLTRYTYTTAGRTVVGTIEDPRGYITSYQYDGDFRVVSMIAGAAVWSWDHSEIGTSVLRDPMGALTTYSYDGIGDLVFEQRPEGYGIGYAYQDRLKAYEVYPDYRKLLVGYDSMGRVLSGSVFLRSARQPNDIHLHGSGRSRVDQETRQYANHLRV